MLTCSKRVLKVLTVTVISCVICISLILQYKLRSENEMRNQSNGTIWVIGIPNANLTERIDSYNRVISNLREKTFLTESAGKWKDVAHDNLDIIRCKFKFKSKLSCLCIKCMA